MNIWLIEIGESLPIKHNIKKLRMAMLSEKLSGKGHSVLWWASAFDHFKKDWVFYKDTEYEFSNNIKIKVLKGIGYKKNISFSRFIDHRIIARKFKKFAHNMPKPDIIIASMPSYDLSYEAVMFANKNKIPVLVDIQDQWPDIFIDHIPIKLRKIGRIILYKDFLMLKKSMQMSSGVISMMNTLLEWGLKLARRKKTWKDKIFYLGCKKPISIKKDINTNLEFLNNSTYKFVVTFIGTFASYHNPSILVDCANKLADSNICIILAGNGELFNKIKNKASSTHNVVLPGWLNQEEINILLKHSHVGICPANHIADFFPNKAFSYLSAGLPVISAFQGDLKEIIEKYEIGFYYPPNDLDTLVNCIKRLYDENSLYRRMSENASRLFEEMFDADKIYNEYAEHIERIVHDFNLNNKTHGVTPDKIRE